MPGKALLVAGLLLRAAGAAVSGGQEVARVSDAIHKGFEPVYLTRLNGPVTLDGRVDEPCWKEVDPLPVVMFEPRFGDSPSERTEIRVAYDESFFYVSGRLFDSRPDMIQSTSRQRDSDNPSCEWFGVMIDTFCDKENALAFFTTPAGLRWDAAVANDAKDESPLNVSWNTFWDVAVSRDGQGWSAEFRIPFSSLRFQDRDGRVVMGLIAWRRIARKNESIIFPAVPPDWGFFSRFKPSQAGEVLMEGISSRRPLYFAPYILGGFQRAQELDTAGIAYNHRNSLEREIGLDLKYGLTSNLTLDLTVNTDFAQVEADDQQVNLTRFSLFFPEKRLFFQERAGIFDFNFGSVNRLFYSRRIGLHEGIPVPIYGGGRLVGRVGGWDLGLLDLQTAAAGGLPSENFGVARLRRRVLNSYSYAGGMITSRVGADGASNLAYGLDAVLRLFGDQYLTVKWAQTFASGRRDRPLSTAPSRFHLAWERRTFKGLGYDLMFSYAGRDYDPGIGYQLRGNYTCLYDKVWYGWYPGGDSGLFSHRVLLDGLLILGNTDGSVESAHLSGGYNFAFKSGFNGEITPIFQFENVPALFRLGEGACIPAGRYFFFGVKGELSSPDVRRLRLSSAFELGGFYDGSRITLEWEPYWSVSALFELSGFYQYNRLAFPERDEGMTAHVARLRALLTPSTRFSAAAFLQFNSSDRAMIANLRLRYNPREGVDFYLVYNETLNTGRFRETPIPPLSAGRTILVKYTYTFQTK